MKDGVTYRDVEFTINGVHDLGLGRNITDLGTWVGSDIDGVYVDSENNIKIHSRQHGFCSKEEYERSLHISFTLKFETKVL